MDVEIETVRTADEETVAALASLLPQLSTTAPPPDREAVERLLASGSTTLLLARLDGAAVGMLTLVVYPLASGLRAWIEDVVVDAAARGRGVGAALTGTALRLAEEAGAVTVDLTSRPSREAANRLYLRAGFEARDTRVYRYTVSR